MQSNIIYLILLFIILFGGLSAQNNEQTLLFDATCMKKFDYERSEDFKDLAFWDYHMSVDNDTKLIFRVMKQEAYLDEVAALSKEPLRCGDAFFKNDSILENLNASKLSFNIAEYVLETRNYKIFTVKKVMIVRENNFDYSSSGDDFISYSKKSLKIGDNIDSSGGRVLFTGDSTFYCFKTKFFRKYDKVQPRFFEELTFVEGLGLISLSKSSEDNKKPNLKLSSINGVKFEEFVLTKCNTQALQDSLPNTQVQTDTFVLDSLGIYTVKSGDNLYRIAKQFKTKVDVLMSINNLSSEDAKNLKVGQKLKIHEVELLPDSNPIEIRDEKNGLLIRKHIVRQGETLTDIAGKYSVTVTYLKTLNNLEDNNIDLFQEILIEVKKANK